MRAPSPSGLNDVPRSCGSGFATATPGNPTAASHVKDDRQRLRVLYSGHVQGVGFRYTARELAAGFDVCGTVRNLADGRVELVAEGARDEIESFRQAIRDSGLGCLIRDEDVRPEAPRHDLRGFDIVR